LDETARVPLAEAIPGVRDRDVMNLLDQLELYMLRVEGKQVSQKDYWLFVYESMKSGLLMTKSLEKHLRYKLKELGVDLQNAQPVS
jgi:hypothetical protein